MLISNDAALTRIIADAATLGDRLGADWSPDEGSDSAAVAQSRLERWRDRAAQGDDALFRERLSWIGCTPESVQVRLGNGALRSTPDWAHVFASAMRRDAIPPDAAARHPFGPALSGFAAEAVSRLDPVCHDAFAPAAMATLIDDLFVQLSYLAAPALQLEFAVFRTANGAADAFERFLADLRVGGLWRFFAEYAALARLLSVTVLHWVAHIAALATDFLSDRSAIAAHFGGGDPGMIVAVRPSLSDPHNHGRAVVVVTCASGQTLVYKPRPVGIEAAWFDLLRTLDGACGRFRALLVLACGDHGWVEAAQPRPCSGPDGVRQFYRRAGNLLALMYALEASDCFHENIIADGDFPVLIDMETLMHHVLRPPADLAPAEAAAGDILFDSVLRAGFLPVWEATGRDGLCVDISGLGAQLGQTTPYLRRRWTDVNTDGMEMHQEPIVIETDDHLPRLHDATVRVAAYVQDVVDGFRETYTGLIEWRGALLGAGGAIDRLCPEALRLVFHPTRLYGLMLKRLAAPRALRSGVERSVDLDVLARLYLGSRVKQPFQAILAAELEAMERQDIPYFNLRADAEDLVLPTGARIPHAFAETAIDRVRSRLARFGQDDLALQCEFIRASLVMAATTVHAAEPIAATAEPRSTDAEQGVSGDKLIETAAGIAEGLKARAIRTGDGEAIWIAPQMLPGTARYELRALRMDVYGGLAGVALFLAALVRTTGAFRSLALEALAPLRRFLARADARAVLGAGYTIGGATGIGSFIYALTRCATLLDMPALLADATTAAALLTDDVVAADVEHDVMSGAAGAILGLLALHETNGDRHSLARARACGEHLLTRAISIGDGLGWRSGRHPPTTGLSHGAAGIALALLRLAATTDDERFARAADRALAFERAAFDAGQGNWRDLRDGSDDSPSFMNAWCHGALGIGLARVASLPLRDDAGMRADIDAAVRLNAGSWFGAKDGLCCGNMARAELLLTAPGVGAQAASVLTAGVLGRAEGRGGFALSGTSGTDFFDPSLYQGLSGIGYQCLRLAEPDQVPALLVWE